jgi:phenylacetate-CoA ligase
MTVISDFRKRDYRRSSELRALQLAVGADIAVRTLEVPPNACNVVCGLGETGPQDLLGYLWYAFRRRDFFSQEARTELRGRIERRFVMPIHALPPLEAMPARELTEVLDHYLKEIAARRPLHLRGLPVYLLWLADRCLELRQRTGLAGSPSRAPAFSGLGVVSPYGGLASPTMASRIAAGFGCRFADKYGASEFGAVASTCGRSPGMHLFEDLFIVELLRGGQPVPPGEVGRLVLTDLVNTAMPLIRYDVGDVGRLHTGPCPCGRKTPRLEVLGRAQEVLASPDGPITPSTVADTFFKDPAIANFRLEEVAPGSFEAAVVASVSTASPTAGSAAPDLEGWKERFAALLQSRGLQARKLRARVVPFVRPEPSGKYRFVLPSPSGVEAL